MVDTTTTTFYLVRHGEALINVRPDLWELSDCSLTERGRQQVTKLAERLSSYPLDAIYASTMRRARESAEIIAAASHAPVIYVDWLQEMDYGDLDHLSIDEINHLYPGVSAAGKHSWDQGFPHGETIRTFYDRVSAAVRALIDKPDLPENVALVAHAGSLEVILANLLNIPLIPSDRFVIDNASLSIVVRHPSANGPAPMLALHNDTSHWRMAGI